ncbi:hypothetical protein Jiend_31660 [Micromonospora endophytica]|nr:hypothetical protein Jiend_31660 [Micromonospora endophytica]
MTAPDEGFDWQAAETDLTNTPGPGAEVVDLDAARSRRVPPPRTPTDTTDDEDAETVDAGPDRVGGLVDMADDIPADVAGRQQHRRPILADWARSGRALRAAVKHQSKDVGYVTAYHGVRLPKYAVKALAWAPIGAVRSIGNAVRWAAAEEGNWHLRQAAASRGDADTWLKLDARRQRQSVWRWWVLAAATAGTGTGVIVLAAGPSWWSAVAGAVVVPWLATRGRPADRPLTDRVTEGTRYRKLTAELVRRALTSLQMAAINSAVAKDPKAITFPVDIHRDGPGHLAVVDLPYGVEAAEVVARRGRLASAMRLPLDQVWPEPAPVTPDAWPCGSATNPPRR